MNVMFVRKIIYIYIYTYIITPDLQYDFMKIKVLRIHNTRSSTTTSSFNSNMLKNHGVGGYQCEINLISQIIIRFYCRDMSLIPSSWFNLLRDKKI